MIWWFVGFASAAVLLVAAKQYYHGKRIVQRLKGRLGLSRADFVDSFSREGISTDISAAVYDLLVRNGYGVCPEDDLMYVYGMDNELFLDSLHALRNELGITGESLRVASGEFGNVSSVRDLVQLLACARGPRGGNRLNS